MNSGKKGFLKTSAYAVFSQIVSLGCGIVTSLLLPKILGTIRLLAIFLLV